jgi:hypothetical protein
VTVPADNLTAKLEEVKAALAATQTGFPNTIDRNKIIDYLLDLADEYRIQILPLESDGWNVVNIGQDYRVLRMGIIADGSLKDVEAFIIGLQTGRYPTLVVSDFTIGRDVVASPGFPGDEMQVSVNLRIGIYTIASPLTEDSI